MMKTLRDQRGVAIITVLFIGAALTIVASTAGFVTIREFRAGGDDRRGAEALAFAEAGVDKVVEVLRSGGPYVQSTPTQPDVQKSGLPSWGELNESGCALGPLELPAGDLGSGRGYTAHITVYDPTKPLGQRIPPIDPWSASNDTASPICTERETSPRAFEDDRTDHLFAISSLGSHPAAKRKVLQVIDIRALGLPIGVYADRSSNNGNPDFDSISLVTPGDVTGREKMSMKGYDPYYTMWDFYGDPYSAEEPIRTAVHAMGNISCISNCNSPPHNRKQVHPPSPNCQANGTKDGGYAWQSLWDGSGLGTTITSDCTRPAGTGTLPPTALFDSAAMERVTPQPVLTEDDHARLKAAAQRYGIYCTDIGGSYCTINGGPQVGLDLNWTTGEVASFKNFIAYFDFAPTNNKKTVTWNADVSTCTDDPSTNRSVVFIGRNTNVTTQGAGGGEAVGAFIIPEGNFDAAGSITIHGTIIAQSFSVRGNAEFKNSVCWVRNMPSAFLDYSPTRWIEVDR